MAHGERKNRILALIGAGNMGAAMALRLCQGQPAAWVQLRVFDPDAQKLTELRETLPGDFLYTAADTSDAVHKATDVLLAVKPQIAFSCLEGLAENWPDRANLISVAAGLEIAALRRGLGRMVPVLRLMPNLAVRTGDGVIAYAAADLSEAELGFWTAMLERCGLALPLDESQFDAVTGLSGSGPAFVLVMIEAMADAAVRLGISRASAQRMAIQTVLGASRMAGASGEHPAVLRDRVSSPAGTTIAGLARLDAGGFRAAVQEAVIAAAARASELRAGTGHGR